jgi:predicted ATPase
MGLHTGNPQLTGGHYVGLDVHRAARVMAAGHGGQVLISGSTRRLLDDATGVRDLGEHRLKDLLQPEHIYQLIVQDLDNEFPALKTLSDRPNNLPIQPTPLIGRQEQLADLRLVREEGARLITMIGTGGSGKSHLALQLAADLLDEFPSGCFFVSLAPIVAPALVVPTIAQTLAVREQTDEPILETLSRYLREKKILLVLDNFEQVVDAAPDLSVLLASAPDIQLIVTSRERLHIQAERVYEVPPLTEAEARELFLARAQATRADLHVSDEDVPVVAEICRRLDHLPLAIELAAARAPLLSPRALLERLEQRLSILTGGARDVPERQRTLRAAIAWSHDLLDGADQRLFRRLAVFVNGCTIDAAESVCDVTIDGLQSLFEKNLLRRREGPSSESRYWMLETIREFAVEELGKTGEAGEFRRRHARFFTDLVVRGDQEIRGREQRVWVQRLAADHDNIRAAIAWAIEGGTGETALRLTGSMAHFWWLRGHAGEAERWLRGALELRHGEEAALVGPVVDAAGWFAMTMGDFEAARVHGEEALAIADSLGDLKARGRALNILAHVLEGLGRYAEVLPLEEEILAINTRLGNEVGIVVSMMNLAIVMMLEERYEDGRALLVEALDRARGAGNEASEAGCLLYLGLASLLEGRTEESAESLHEALRIAHELELPAETAGALVGLAWKRAEEGDSKGAARLAGAGERIYETTGMALDLVESRARERLIEALRDTLDPASLEEAWIRGAGFPLRRPWQRRLPCRLGPLGPDGASDPTRFPQRISTTRSAFCWFRWLVQSAQADC